ncbi:unnamed protein product [Cercospora beticola]|nr:unnamed protein product [Cercospora beticola]
MKFMAYLIALLPVVYAAALPEQDIVPPCCSLCEPFSPCTTKCKKGCVSVKLS